MARILAVDYGRRRLGIALSDPTGTIAQPLTTLARRAGKRPPVQAILGLCEEHGVGALVVGLPLSLAGAETDWTREVREFAATLGTRSGLTVHFVDERFTSAAATRAVRDVGLRRQARREKGRVDASAAALILQAFLDRPKTDS